MVSHRGRVSYRIHFREPRTLRLGATRCAEAQTSLVTGVSSLSGKDDVWVSALGANDEQGYQPFGAARTASSMW